MKHKTYGFWDKLPTSKPLAWIFTLFIMWLVGSSYLTGRDIPEIAGSVLKTMGPVMILAYFGKSGWEHQTNVRAEEREECGENDTR